MPRAARTVLQPVIAPSVAAPALPTPTAPTAMAHEPCEDAAACVLPVLRETGQAMQNLI